MTTSASTLSEAQPCVVYSSASEINWLNLTSFGTKTARKLSSNNSVQGNSNLHTNILADSTIIPPAVKATEQEKEHLTNVSFNTLELSSRNRRLQNQLFGPRKKTKTFVKRVKPNPLEKMASSSSSAARPIETGTFQLPIQQVPPLNPLQFSFFAPGPSSYHPLLLQPVGAPNQQLVMAIDPDRNFRNPPTTTMSFPLEVNKQKIDSHCCRREFSNATPQQQQDPICSCCCDDQAGSLSNSSYYAELNEMAQNWINGLTLESTARTKRSPVNDKKHRRRQRQTKDLKFQSGRRFKSSTTTSVRMSFNGWK